MTDRATIAQLAATGLRNFAPQLPQSPALVGFDGFVDSIIAVVDKRHTVDSFDPVHTIAQFGQKILAAAGHSANYELSVKLQKLGGNGPIMANALAVAGFPVTYIGALGYPEIHPVFQPFAKIAKCLSVCEPGYTDAVEFDDGKLMLGKYESINAINPPHIDQTIGHATFAQIVDQSRFLGMVNWTMLVYMNDIFSRLADEILPNCKQRKLVFVDLADPEKRTADDKRDVLDILTKMQKPADVMLGLNLKEAVQIAEVLSIDPTSNPEAAIEKLATEIRAKLNIHGVVVHPRAGAAACILENGKPVSANFRGPFVAKPKLSTGAGDNFNAGFCLGVLAGLPVDQALCTGTATSGYYVRNAGSPTLAQLADFCDELPQPE